MADYFLVRQARGPAWDPALGRREQAGWDKHVVFMNALTDEGVVVLGGPVGEIDGQHVLLVTAAESEEAIRARLADDPWDDTVLTIESVEPWTLWIRGGTL